MYPDIRTVEKQIVKLEELLMQREQFLIRFWLMKIYSKLNNPHKVIYLFPGLQFEPNPNQHTQRMHALILLLISY
jgi:hypothetical protein